MSDDPNAVPSSEPDDIGKTQQMNEPPAESPAPAEKPAKKPGDWVTVETPKARRSAAPATPPAAPTPTPAPTPMAEQTPVMPAAKSPMPSAPAATAAPAAPSGAGAATGVPLGSTLANMGVKEPGQQWAVLVGVVLLALCCVCGCAALALNFLGVFSS